MRWLCLIIIAGCASVPATSPSPEGRLSPRIIQAVISLESGGNPRAVSRAGALGLMQVLPATGRSLGFSRTDLRAPTKNVEAGTKYLTMMIDRFDGDLFKALAAYNCGPGKWRNCKGYARRVLRLAGEGQ